MTTPDPQGPEDQPTSRIALVTGATRGIGRAIALELARDGFDVAFCYLKASDAADTLEREIREMGRRVLRRQLDVSDFDAAQAFVQAVEDELGEIDLLVNNAGIVKDNPLVLLERSAWRDVITTNLDSVFNFCRSVIFPFMKRKRGNIINISSVAGVFGNPAQTNYCAAKAGIIGFSKALAKESGAYGIRVNVVAPGFIKTDMTQDLSPKVVQRIMPNIPLRRLGEAQEVADLVSFLASDRAKYITAQTFHVDGGLMI
jgi:3-oxoacyl-[acyl-carrier protein] reductase